jgi:hypothetical protein
MSMALLVGFAFAYPMNWWLVRCHLKHGMITVRPKSVMPAAPMQGHGGRSMHGDMSKEHKMGHAAMAAAEPLRPPVSLMAGLSFAALGAGLIIALFVAPREIGEGGVRPLFVC